MTDGYKVRTTIIFLFFCFCYLVIIFNLGLIQICQRSFFAQLAHKQYDITVTNHPARALIYDRYGNPLAINKESVSAFITPNKLENKEKLIAFLNKEFPHAAQRLSTHNTDNFMYLQRHLSEKQIEIIKQSGLTDIHMLCEPCRFYPIPCAAPVVGFTDIDTHGLCGIEGTYEELLRGKPTVYHLEKDARSGYFHFTKQAYDTGYDGNPLTLTIDSTLQFLAQEELNKTAQQFNAREGAIIIINPDNGDIIAMAQYPSFDPHQRKNIVLEQTKNKLLTDTYELGSVIKVCTALAALEEKVVSIDEPIDCKGTKTAYIDGRCINTWKEHGVIPFCDVIAFSNNIGIAQVAKRLDAKLYDHYRRLGFGTKTGIDFPGEQEGFVNPPRNWSKHSIISLSYGYEIRATLLQLARVFSMIANGGYEITPRLLLPATKNVPSPTALSCDITPTYRKRLYCPETIEYIQSILERTTQSGTAKRAQLKGYKIMAKTGSANLLVNGRYNDQKSLFTCAGIVQKDSYKRVIITFIKEVDRTNIFASTVAVPLFEQVAEKMIIHDKVI